ncbi:MAG: hypothetical protein HQK83_09920 [Fibrobacteria bacterium]|nr:hypothetical protein [Fibrobacteria bacterium]
MLLILASWVYIVFLSFVYGAGLLFIFFKQDIRPNKESVELPLILVNGMIVITCIAALLSCLFKTGLVTQIVLLAGCLVIVPVYKRALCHLVIIYFMEIKQAKMVSLLLFAVFAGIALTHSTVMGTTYDHGLYYIQTIKWYNAYPAVPGLGNFDFQLAKNSSWHLLSAVFSFSWLSFIPFYHLNGLFYLIMSGYACLGLNRIMKGHQGAWLYAALLLVLPIWLLRPFAMAPGPDFITLYVVFLVFLLLLKKHEKKTFFVPDSYFFLIIAFSAYALTIKPSSFPVVLMALYVCIATFKYDWKKCLMIAGSIGLIIIVPWVIRNIIMTGYIYFLFPQLDVFSVEWKMSSAYIARVVMVIKNWAILPLIPAGELAQMSLLEWVPRWFEKLPVLHARMLVTSIACSATIICFFVYHAIKRKLEFVRKNQFYLVTGLCLYGGILFWFFLAPDFRFGFGFILSLFVWFGLVSCRYFQLGKFSKYAVYPLLASLFLFAAMQMPTTLHFAYKIFANDYEIIPSPEFSYYQLKRIVIDGESYNLPLESDQCWDAPLPCLISGNRDFKRRGERWQDGFSWKEREQP